MNHIFNHSTVNSPHDLLESAFGALARWKKGTAGIIRQKGKGLKFFRGGLVYPIYFLRFFDGRNYFDEGSFPGYLIYQTNRSGQGWFVLADEKEQLLSASAMGDNFTCTFEYIVQEDPSDKGTRTGGKAVLSPLGALSAYAQDERILDLWVLEGENLRESASTYKQNNESRAMQVPAEEQKWPTEIPYPQGNSPYDLPMHEEALPN